MIGLIPVDHADCGALRLTIACEPISTLTEEKRRGKHIVVLGKKKGSGVMSYWRESWQ